MSIGSWIQNFRESCKKKKDVRAQIQVQAPADDPESAPEQAAAEELAVWTTGPTVTFRGTGEQRAPAWEEENALASDPRSLPPGLPVVAPPVVAGAIPGGFQESLLEELEGNRQGLAQGNMPGGRAGESYPLLSEGDGSYRYMADVPGELRDRIQQEGLARVFRSLETPLRALNMATSSHDANYSAEDLRGFLVMWRQALADYVGLAPDPRAVLIYDRNVDEAYFIRGRCEPGTSLRVVQPCWKLKGQVVIRGEAQVIPGGDARR